MASFDCGPVDENPLQKWEYELIEYSLLGRSMLKQLGDKGYYLVQVYDDLCIFVRPNVEQAKRLKRGQEKRYKS